MLDISLKNRHALVCGSTQGIGHAIAHLFAECGASVILMARDQEALKKVRGELAMKGGQEHSYVVADFNDTEKLKEILIDNQELLGKATILVNNSGGPPGGNIREADQDEFRIAFERHLIASHLLVKTLMPAMIRSEVGRVINIISTSVKSPIPGLGVSNTIRGAVASWAKTLASELGPYGITVNNLLPGFTSTGRLQSIIDSKAKKQRVDASVVKERMIQEIPSRRFADAREIAAAATFLASSEASYINGINLPVDGGRLSCL